jgi:hypothetical protein
MHVICGCGADWVLFRQMGAQRSVRGLLTFSLRLGLDLVAKRRCAALTNICWTCFEGSGRVALIGNEGIATLLVIGTEYIAAGRHRCHRAERIRVTATHTRALDVSMSFSMSFVLYP